MTAYSFTDLITFTRASEGSYIDSAGVLHWFAAGVPRLGDRGLLIEGGRTNLVYPSEDMGSGSGWVGSAVVVTTDATAAPDGTMADHVAADDSTGTHLRGIIRAGFADDTVYCGSIFAKAEELRNLTIRLESTAFSGQALSAWADLVAGEIYQTGAHTIDAGIEPLADGWFRIWLTGESIASGNGALTAYVVDDDQQQSYTGDNASGLYIWGAQVEAGGHPTSYIRTEDSAVARAADVASIDLTSADWFNPIEGAMVAEFALGTTVAVHAIWQMDDGSNENRVLNRTQGTGSNLLYAFAVVDNSQTVGINLGAVSPGNVYRAAYSFAEDDFRASLGGAAVGSDTSGDMPEMTRLLLGKEHVGSFLNGYIRSLVYYPRALGDAQLRSLSRL